MRPSLNATLLDALEQAGARISDGARSEHIATVYLESVDRVAMARALSKVGAHQLAEEWQHFDQPSCRLELHAQPGAPMSKNAVLVTISAAFEFVEDLRRLGPVLVLPTRSHPLVDECPF